LDGQQVADARALEGAIHGPRPRDQREVPSALPAQLAADRDHGDASRVDVGELAQIERDAGHIFFAQALYLGVQHACSALVQLADKA